MELKEKYCTVSEAAEELGVTRQTVSRWISDGKLVAETIGREKLIDKKQLDQFADIRVSMLLARYVDRKLIAHIKKQYNYTKEDVIERFGTKSTPTAISYSIIKKDGTRERVWVYLGKIEMSKDGLVRLEIKKVTRTIEAKRKGTIE
jgi:excisionase family DNA binding protein